MSEIKILIVEDEAIVAEVFSDQLVDMGYKVVGVSATYEDAVKKAEELQPDLIMMDIMLKGVKTGIDAAVEIKKKKDIPIIYVTAYSDDNFVKKAESTGPDAYIVKPVDINKVADCINLIFLKRTREMNLAEKTKKLEKEKDPGKRLALKKEVAEAHAQVEIQRKKRMIFIDS